MAKTESYEFWSQFSSIPGNHPFEGHTLFMDSSSGEWAIFDKDHRFMGDGFGLDDVPDPWAKDYLLFYNPDLEDELGEDTLESMSVQDIKDWAEAHDIELDMG